MPTPREEWVSVSVKLPPEGVEYVKDIAEQTGDDFDTCMEAILRHGALILECLKAGIISIESLTDTESQVPSSDRRHPGKRSERYRR